MRILKKIRIFYNDCRVIRLSSKNKIYIFIWSLSSNYDDQYNITNYNSKFRKNLRELNRLINVCVIKITEYFIVEEIIFVTYLRVFSRPYECTYV